MLDREPNSSVAGTEIGGDRVLRVISVMPGLWLAGADLAKLIGPTLRAGSKWGGMTTVRKYQATPVRGNQDALTAAHHPPDENHRPLTE
jgi:hypothetical protein